MALFNFFKKKEKGKEKKKSEKKIKKPLEKKVKTKSVEKVKPVEKIKPEEKIKPIEPKIKKKISEKAHKVLCSPHITEKAADFEKQNKYIFKVWPKTNKVEIKESVEGVYGVDVMAVRIINVPRRQRRLGRHKGWRKGYKKAIVKVKEGQKIEILPR